MERAAHRVTGVRAVAGDIEVRLEPDDEPTDTEIAIAAARALEWDSFVPAERLDVTVANGWVVLRGEVEFGWQRRTAEGELRRLRGVRGVTDLVEVRPAAPPPPEEVVRDLLRALRRRPGTGRVDARLVGDAVLLTGEVRTARDRDEAERVAWSAPGVRTVDARLVLTG